MTTRHMPWGPLTADEERELRARWSEFLDAVDPNYHPTGVVPRLLATLDAARSESPSPGGLRHRLLWPPHPGDVYSSSALCSCGDFQWDADSQGALFNATGDVLSDWTVHAVVVAKARSGDGLDVERLAKALTEALSAMDDEWIVSECAEYAAAEYARLAATEQGERT